MQHLIKKLLPILLICPWHIWSQVTAVCKLHHVDNFNLYAEETNKLISLTDSTQYHNTLLAWVHKWRDEGYLTASLDNVQRHADTILFNVYKGPIYTLSQLRIRDQDQAYVNAASLDRYKFKNKVLKAETINNYLITLIIHLTNHGYPFAAANIDSLRDKEGNMNAVLNLQKGELYLYDTLHIDTPLISKNFLIKYLNIVPGEPYRQKDISSLQSKINNLGYLILKDPPGLNFDQQIAKIYLPLKDTKANTFDFVLGILPSNQNGQRKLNFNVDLKADYLNRFKRGERLYLQMRRVNTNDQMLETKVSIPYLLQLPIGVEAQFDILRNRDQSIDIHFNLGSQYMIRGFDQIKIYGVFNKSNLINIDTSAIIAKNRLPSNLDYSYRGMGIESIMQRFDYRFNPRSGWANKFNINLGQRTVRRNNEIEAIQSQDFTAAYDTINTNVLQVNILAQTDYFLPIFNKSTIRLATNAGIKIAPTTLAQNEVFRIGGNKLLRGFDELSIITDRYIMWTIEYRLLLDQNSYITLPFFDISRMRAYAEDDLIYDTAFSAGMGLNFATKSGIFNVSFAAGSRLNNPIDFNATKVHFGYVNLF